MSRNIEKRVPDDFYRIRLVQTVLEEANRVDVDPQLVLAVMAIESNFNRYAESGAGAQGLMQVMPFWKKELRGKSLQIIEGVELDNSIEEHKKAISNSTHFNPVMLICGITNYKGEKFSLHDFRDEKRSMISRKVYKNKSIKILEWPGLWNGGMAEWNSIFVEVPKETFNPVKSIIDLLR